MRGRIIARTSGNLIDVLSQLRTKALRKRIWFSTLSFEERILTSVIRQHVKIVRNCVLATVLARIMGKLIYAIKNSFLAKIENWGRPIAKAWALGAYSCGNKDALKWMEDLDVIRYLGLMAYNRTMPRVGKL